MTAARAALKEFGSIDILVNNAAVALIAPLLKLSVEDWDTTMAVNLRAPFLIARELAPQMIAQESRQDHQCVVPGRHHRG